MHPVDDAEDFRRFVLARQRDLPRTAWWLSGDWAHGGGPGADRSDPIVAAPVPTRYVGRGEPGSLVGGGVLLSSRRPPCPCLPSAPSV
jgi:hypothetical protein